MYTECPKNLDNLAKKKFQSLTKGEKILFTFLLQFDELFDRTNSKFKLCEVFPFLDTLKIVTEKPNFALLKR